MKCQRETLECYYCNEEIKEENYILYLAECDTMELYFHHTNGEI